MLRRWFGAKQPKWADGLSKETYQSFRAAAEARLDEIGGNASWDEWDAGLVIRHENGRIAHVALARVAAVYAETPAERRPALLDEFFGMVGQPNAFPESWQDARDMLVAKIYPVESFTHNPSEDMVVRQVADDLIALLQIERPGGFVAIPRTAADKWQVPDAEVWDQALENIHARAPVTDETREVADGSHVRALHSENRLAASHLLELQRHLATPAVDGAIVGVPHENLFHFHELADASAEAALGYILSATAEMFTGSPTTGISPHTYWWRDGRLTPVTSLDNESLRLTPPDDFDRLMRRLIGA
jgi:hypothetical protein